MNTITKQKKKKANSNCISIEQADNHLGKYTSALSSRKMLEVKIEKLINEVREEFSEQLNKLSKKIEKEYNILSDYATQNKEQFKERKSLDLTHGTIGFRTGMPKIKKPDGISWDEIVSILNTKRYIEFLRIKLEVDKEEIISKRDTIKVQSLKRDCKLDIVQEEIFFVMGK